MIKIILQIFVDEIPSQKRIKQTLLNAQAENNVLLKQLLREKEITTKFPIHQICKVIDKLKMIEKHKSYYILQVPT